MKNILIPFFIFNVLIVSAKKYDMVNLTNNDGLSNSSINHIFQDSNGLLWFGTWDGLNVYNGREFKVFKPEPGNSQSISNNIIRDIVEENINIRWIATDYGINRMDMRRKSFERFFISKQYATISSENSFLIAKNSSNNIFVGVNGKGLFFYQSQTKQFVRIKNVSNYRLRKIFFDQDDNLWLYTYEKMLLKVIFRKGNYPESSVANVISFQHVKGIESVFINNANVMWMQTAEGKVYSYRISEGILSEAPMQPYKVGIIKAMVFKDSYQLWGTTSGLYRVYPEKKKIEQILPNISVLSVFCGTQQVIWVGTDMQGVWQLSPSRESFRSYSALNIPSFGNSAVRTFFEETNHTLWIGTKGSGIYMFQRKENSEELQCRTHITTQNGLLSNAVFTIVKGKESEYWIGTDGNGINYFDPKIKKIFTLSIAANLATKVNLTSVYSILPTEKNILWVGTSGNGMYKLEVNTTTRPYSVRSFKQYVYAENNKSLSNNIVYSIIKDDYDHLWIGTRGGGLNRFNIKTENFETFRFSPNIAGCISSDDILCLYKDEQEHLWAGTSMGLNKLLYFKNGNPVFAHFTEKEGLPNNTIHGILEDGKHDIWLSTNKGIAKLIKERGVYRIISYFQKDGLQNNEFSDGAFYQSPYSNLLYFGGISGFNMFNPLEIIHGSYMPRLLLNAFYLDNIETNLSDYLFSKKQGETLVLSHKNKSFSFKFIPLDYLTGSKCEISYMLEGFQKDWIHLGTSNTIVFTNVPKGDYILKVRCTNADKQWSDKYYRLPIRILPPWWDSDYAYVCYVILLTGLFLAIRSLVQYQFRVRNDIRMKELERQKAEEIHQAKLSFFTNIAHEFSNSLTLIYGPCEQLLRSHISDTTIRKYIRIIKSNSERMQTLIQQMIDFRKAETGHLKLAIERVDIIELVKFVADNFLDMLEQKRISLTLSFTPDKIIWQTDRSSIEKIVFNLLSNAVKYTPENENVDVKIEIKDNRLYIKVINTGVGIKPAFQESIFDHFVVLDRFEHQVLKGQETRNGIGLALCKNLAEVLHGNIKVKSDGETFTLFEVNIPEQPADTVIDTSETLSTLNFTMPAVVEAEKKEEKPKMVIPDVSKEGLILIVDDDKEIRELLTDLLKDKYEIAEASNGKEAIESMKIRMPLLIISDIIMPVMDGVQFVRIMKSQELTRHIPIILLSSKGSIENHIEGLEIGADAYLSKPFHPRHLETMVGNMLHQNKAVLDYSESAYAALEQFEGKLIHKEDKTLLLTITKIIQDHIDNEALCLEFIARETAHSKMQIYRKIKELIGQTPTEFIRSIRLKHAEKLLKTTNKTVQEIMFNCGFNNKAYFYREFAKKYHLTPKEYRNSYSAEKN